MIMVMSQGAGCPLGLLFLSSALVGLVWSSLNTDKPLSDNHQLFNDLFLNYNKHVRPVTHQTETTFVFFEIALFNVLALKTREQRLIINTEMIMKWRDHYLSWDPASYNNTELIIVPHTHIWYPDIILMNSAVSGYELGILNTNARIYYTGEVQLVSHAFFQSTCNVDTLWYPFDQQDCLLNFASWTYSAEELQLVKGPGDLTEYTPHPEFYLENFYSVLHSVHDPCCIIPFSFVTYHIQVQRRVLFALFFFILPGTIVNVCALMTFLLPAESGEKVSLATNALLAMMVFLMAMSQEIPPTQQIPLIGRYYGGSILMLGVNIIISVISLTCHYSVDTSVPNSISIVSQFLGRWLWVTPPEDLKAKWNEESRKAACRLNAKSPQAKMVQVEPLNTPERHKADSNMDEYQQRNLEALEGIHFLLADKENKKSQQASLTSVRVLEWRNLCQVIDRISFIASVIIFFIFALAVLLSSPQNKNFTYCPEGPGNCPKDWDADHVGNMVDSGRANEVLPKYSQSQASLASPEIPISEEDGTYHGITDP
ncbi:acetylcholine receptor subunit alpha-type unc-63-like [Homarus americanus]|uniref:acetylcholine receptor subunit alpha-type unc-63-like n=1 Tax=Homarus americanus TaxID=6706 RepID=UPI001C46A3A4|nr:acetylcholine receptor subunit alpha-type unc-63-like [Homarus americanus]